MKFSGWLKAIGAAITALAAVIAGAVVMRRITAVQGAVEAGGDQWMPSPRMDREILVTIPGEPDLARVTLPDGITSDQVRAVKVSPMARSAVVEVKHEAKSRQAMLAGKGAAALVAVFAASWSLQGPHLAAQEQLSWTPLTMEEAAEYVARFPEEAASDIAKLDAIEHSVPVVTLPRGVIVVTDREIGWSWTDRMRVVIANGALEYEIELPSGKVPRPYPKAWPYFVSGGVGVIVGGIIVGLIASAVN